MTTVLTNAALLDVESGERTEGSWIAFANGKVADRGTGVLSLPRSEETRTIDVAGATVLPGLIDCHVHLTVTSVDTQEWASWTLGYAAARTHKMAERMLRRGFTSVRDVGGADYGLARAAAEGLFLSPRIFYGGRLISQTGGHGDYRPLPSADSCGCDGVGISTIVDGPEEMRRVVRHELRRGANHIKLAASGGVASPHDELDAVQYSVDEIRIAVLEAENANRYVTVHAYHPRAIKQALDAGVHCVEHGNLLDAETISTMAKKQVFLVPTFVTYQLLHEHGKEAGLWEASLAKLEEVRTAGLKAYEEARKQGVPIAYGTDLLGRMESAQLDEFAIRSQVAPAIDLIREATCNAAKLLRQEGRLGTLQVGAEGDAIVFDGDPLSDATVLPGLESRLRYVIQRGGIVIEPR